MARTRVIPRYFPELSERDWCEIYYALEVPGEVGGKACQVGVDGKGMTEARQSRLSEKDWIEIYLACEDRRDALKAGLLGKDRMTREWRDHMDSILGILDVVREKFIGGRAA